MTEKEIYDLKAQGYKYWEVRGRQGVAGKLRTWFGHAKTADDAAAFFLEVMSVKYPGIHVVDVKQSWF